MKNQCQKMIETQWNELLRILQKFQKLFGVTLGT